MSSSTKKQDETRTYFMTEPTDICDVERFAPMELMMLHTRLSGAQVDSFQAAEIVADFLSGRGYGVSKHEARQLVARIDSNRCSVEHIQAELERVARVM
jgi:hypothetical protein